MQKRVRVVFANDELENEFKISFTVDEVINVKTVGEIKKALRKHGVKADEL